MAKIKCIVKRPEEQYGHMTCISDSLENLQRTVGGHIEPVLIAKTEKDGHVVDVVILCDEEGKLKDKEPNLRLTYDVLVGDIVVLGSDGEEFCDIPITFEEWKQICGRYGA